MINAGSTAIWYGVNIYSLHIYIYIYFFIYCYISYIVHTHYISCCMSVICLVLMWMLHAWSLWQSPDRDIQC